MSVYSASEEEGSAAAAAAPPTTTASAAGDTAFRRAERRYQLHYEQQLRRAKNGRLRGGKLVALPTDFSGVIDIRDPSAAGLDSRQDVERVSLPAAALVFKRHPGLVVFPAALSARVQLQLVRAALEEWPEPPARTNHTRAYGMTLRQLFSAAQQGLSLLREAAEGQLPEQQQRQQQQQQQPSMEQQQAQTQHQEQPVQQQEGKQQTHQQRQAKQQTEQHANNHNCHHQPQQQHQSCQQAAAAAAAPPCQQEQSGLCSSRCWSASGTGPAAAQLLRKLRWVCLGPPFNWTERLYEPHLPHRPLPPVLLQLAQQYAQLAAQALQHTASSTAGAAGSNGRCASSNTDGGQQQHATSAAADCSSMQYAPDAAIVNYYCAGDTLNGHKDDVECDLAQPIVTASLGCEAVLLMGGATRDVEPTALLLRSGDVVVMGREARACYHGVPRVLTDRPLPDELLQAAGDGDSVFAAHLQHMQECRINISVRATQ